jgi:hypothetical protein
VDFCVIKGILQDFTAAKSCFDLSSFHSPIFITLLVHALNQDKQPSLSNNVSLKTEEDIEATVKFFNDMT